MVPVLAATVRTDRCPNRWAKGRRRCKRDLWGATLDRYINLAELVLARWILDASEVSRVEVRGTPLGAEFEVHAWHQIRISAPLNRPTDGVKDDFIGEHCDRLGRIERVRSLSTVTRLVRAKPDGQGCDPLRPYTIRRRSQPITIRIDVNVLGMNPARPDNTRH